MTDDSVALLQTIAQGSEPALRGFYNAHHGRVYAFALKRLKNPAEAADVLNEVMLEVWRSASRYEGRSKVTTWLLGIANHKVIDTLRKRGRHSAEELDFEPIDENQSTVLDALAGAEDAGRVRECIAQLSDAHRAVVHLAFFEDLSYGEIAQVADIPEGTVKTRMYHAKQLLKRCLSKLL